MFDENGQLDSTKALISATLGALGFAVLMLALAWVQSWAEGDLDVVPWEWLVPMALAAGALVMGIICSGILLTHWASGHMEGRTETTYRSEEDRRKVLKRNDQIRRFFHSLTALVLPLVFFSAAQDPWPGPALHWVIAFVASSSLSAFVWWALGVRYRREREREGRQPPSET